MIKSIAAVHRMRERAREQIMESLKSDNLSPGEREELIALGVLSSSGELQAPRETTRKAGFVSLDKHAIQAPSVLREAYDYTRPSSFSRGVRIDLGGYRVLIISGTASVDETGATAHIGDFRAQCWRTYRNITALLESEGAGWKDVLRCTCYLRDIERDYGEFNTVRTAFFRWLQLDPLPASVGVQARLCRETLLVEIEAWAVLKQID